MKTIGIIGGMSWESSAKYYKIINETVRDRLGELHSAKVVLYSVDFYELEKLQRKGEWQKATDLILESAINLDFAEVDFVLICSVTGHEGAERIEKNINIPLLHIADAVNEKIKHLKTVGLLGTKFTMEKDYFKKLLITKVIIPSENERKIIDDIIYKEISVGKLKESSKNLIKMIIKELVQEGAQGVILGCTELGLLIKQKDCDIPVFDTTEIHSKAAVNYALTETNNKFKSYIEPPTKDWGG